MSAFGRLCDRVPLSDITKRSNQHVNYENSLYGQNDNGSCHTDAGGTCTKPVGDICQRDNVMGNPYIPRVMQLQEQGSSEPSELNYRYNAPTAKNIRDLNGAHSWVQEHPEEHKMIQTSLELLMSQSKNAHPPIFSGSCGEDLTNATNFQVQGSVYSSEGHMMTQTPLEVLMSQSRNICPPNLSGSTYSSNGHRMIQTPNDLMMSESRNVSLTNSTGSAVRGEPMNIPSSQVHGHTMIQTPWQMVMSQSTNVCPPSWSGSTYSMEMARLANPQVHSASCSSRGYLMSKSGNVGLPNCTGSAVCGEPTNVPFSQVHGTAYSSSGYKMIQTPLETLMSQRRNVCPPNLSSSTYGVEVASVANPQVYSTAYPSRGHRMIQTPMDPIMFESLNVGLRNSMGSAVGGEPTNISVHDNVYSSNGHKMMETPLEMLMVQSRNILPPNLSRSTCGVELARSANQQVHNTAYSSRGTYDDHDLRLPSMNSRDMRGSGDERANVPFSSHVRARTAMEAEIHQLEHGTDDDGDLPSSSMNDRDMRGSGHTSGNGRATIPASSHARAQPDLEAKIHQLEHETDGYDYLPSPYLNSTDIRGSGNVGGDEKTIVLASSHGRTQKDMQEQIHQLEQQAYCLVLRAFKARSDTITWVRTIKLFLFEKEGLITELREELRVSDEAHRQLLNGINNDDLIHSIREWRTTAGLEESLPDNPIHEPVSDHTTSARKRQKTSKSVTASLAPPSAMHSEQIQVFGGPAVKPTSSSEGRNARGPLMNRYFPGGPAAEFSQAQNVNPLIGRKAMNRWPDDNSFYEVVISDYNPETGLYALVNDINTSNETWEWVDLKKASSLFI
nr:unnamed protein product [Digitaria exilis]